MDEYIGRKALIEKLRTMPIPKQAGRANTWLDNCAAGVNAAIREVASFPAADVMPVVWCKDCKLYRVYMGRSMCAKNATLLDGHEVGLRATEKDGFCNCGAKMDGGVGNAGSM